MQNVYVKSYLKVLSALHCDYSTAQRFLMVYPPVLSKYRSRILHILHTSKIIHSVPLMVCRKDCLACCAVIGISVRVYSYTSMYKLCRLGRAWLEDDGCVREEANAQRRRRRLSLPEI